MLLTASRRQRMRDACTRRRFYQEGASWIFPDVWEEYISVIPEVRPLFCWCLADGKPHINKVSTSIVLDGCRSSAAT